MVRTLIGHHGRQIHKIQDSSNCIISVLDGIPGLHERQVKIEGKSASNLERAVDYIYSVVIDRRISPEPTPRNPFGLSLIIPNFSAGYIIGKRGAFTKKIKSKYNVDLKIVKESPLLNSENENIAVSYI